MMYEVRWVMDVLATSPAMAAKEALTMIEKQKVQFFVVKTKDGVERVFDASKNPPEEI